MPPGNKEVIIGIVAGSIMLLLLGGFILTFLFFYKQKRHVYQQEKEQTKLKFEQELLQTRLEIQEQTFKTISQEIHDNIGQVLSLAKLHLNTINYVETEQIKEKVADARGFISQAIGDLRDLSKTLNPETIAIHGLVVALEIELAQLQKTGVLQTQISVQGRSQKIEARIEIILFRIVQEALHNVVKHAEASKVWVGISYKENVLELLIRDNGKGFLSEKLANEGSGLRNMHHRALLIGAALAIKSGMEEEGTTISVILPTTT